MFLRDMKCSYGWFKRWSQRFQIQLRYSYDDEILEWIMSRWVLQTIDMNIERQINRQI